MYRPSSLLPKSLPLISEGVQEVQKELLFPKLVDYKGTTNAFIFFHPKSYKQTTMPTVYCLDNLTTSPPALYNRGKLNWNFSSRFRLVAANKENSDMSMCSFYTLKVSWPIWIVSHRIFMNEKKVLNKLQLTPADNKFIIRIISCVTNS